MSSLVGTYVNKNLGSELKVTEADDRTGTGQGVFSIGGQSVKVEIHYHFKNSTGNETTIWFKGNIDDPNMYVGGSAYSDNRSFPDLMIAGGYSDLSGTVGYSGKYSKS